MTNLELLMEYMEQNQYFIGNDLLAKYNELLQKEKKEQLTLTDVSNSFNLEIKDRDIATIEAMHDTLLDEKVLGLNARSMKESRALTQRMYKALSKD
tara:strand:+ start:1127 stop:1417 length:291 start_codon:yes stop_codon:yes gene_type:complete